MNCIICQAEISNENKCKKHCLTSTCHCGKILTPNNKTGFCRVHRDRSGENNPMYGKTVFAVWVEKYGEEIALEKKILAKQRSSAASKKAWQDDEYRAKIKETTTGLKRSNEFKQKQRLNAIEQMKDSKQRELRSNAIRESFIRGTHSPDNLSNNVFGNRGYDEHGNFYSSTVEKKRMQFFIDSGYDWKRYSVKDFEFVIQYKWKNKKHLYIPDFLIRIGDRVIIEELKSNIKYISEREIHKAKVARRILKKHNIEYHLNDDIYLEY